jgi:hypothetical protein
MTPATAPRIRCWEPVTIIIAVAIDVRPAVVSCFSFVLFCFDVRYFPRPSAFGCLPYWAPHQYSLAS